MKKFFSANKKRISMVLAVVSVLTLVFGSLAYFTDRVNQQVTFSAATNIIDVDTNGDEPDTDDPGEDLKKVWESQNQVNMDKTGGMIRPGDGYDMSYELANKGDAIDVKETYVLTITDYKDSALNVNSTDPEWRMFTAYTTDAAGAKVGTTPVTVEQISANQIKYTIAPFTLAKAGKQTISREVILNKYAANAFQQSTCTIDFVVEMRQHSDALTASEGWTAIQTDTITIGGTQLKVVPGSN